MKTSKRLLAALLAMVMVLSMAACGGSSGETKGSETKKSGETSAAGENGSAQAADAGETVDLTMAFVVFGSVPNDLEMVNERINDYLKEKLNVTLTLIPINASNYSQQVDLMLTSGEKLDILADGTITAFFNYTSHAAKGQLYPMNELLESYGQGIKDALGEDYIGASAVNGQVYGVATVRDLAARTSLIMKTSAVEKYGIDVNNVKTYEDIETIFDKIRAEEPNITPIMIGQDAGNTIFDSLGLSFDTQGDQLSDMIGVLMDSQVPTIDNYYSTDACKQACQRIRDWYKKGYVIQDAATNQSTATELMKAGTIYGFIANAKPGIEAQTAASVGEDVTEIPLTEVLTDTQKVTGFMLAIAAQSEYPEKAMQVLNLLYSDPVLINLFDHGIEGTHYKFVDESKGIVTYADGLDSSTSGFDMNVDFQFGNQLLSYIWETDSENLWKDMDAFNKSAKVSKAMGFQFDTSSVKTQYAAVSAVIDQYKRSLGQGTVDPDDVLEEFQKKLVDAGIDDVIKEKQAQLDAFINGSAQ